MNEKGEICTRCCKVLGDDDGYKIRMIPYDAEEAEASFTLCNRCHAIYRLATAKWLANSEEDKKK